MVTPAEVANIASGLFMIGLGAFVLSVRPRRPGNIAFVLFSVGFGVSIATSNWVALVVASPMLVLGGGTVANVVAMVGVVGMMLAFPSPIAREQRWIVWSAAGAATATAAATALWGMPPGTFDGTLAFAGLPASGAALVVTYNAVALWLTYMVVAYLFVIAFRATTSPSAETLARRQYSLVTGALLLYAAYVAGAGVAGYPVFPLTPFTRVTSGLLIAAMFGLAALWLRETTRGSETRAARDIALLALALPTLGLILSATGGAFEVRGVLRTASVAVLAYAILRHQLLGLDVRVRWGISRGTVAGFFIAVFFIASEAAQQFFGDQFESSYLGILAAGALVFAIAPLSRLADRWAEKAVPPAASGLEGRVPEAAGSRERVYRDAVRYALRDGLTRREEAHLATLAQELGLGAADALRLRHEVEDDPSGGQA